jgi:hypothetical protein
MKILEPIWHKKRTQNEPIFHDNLTHPKTSPRLHPTVVVANYGFSISLVKWPPLFDIKVAGCRFIGSNRRLQSIFCQILPAIAKYCQPTPPTPYIFHGTGAVHMAAAHKGWLLRRLLLFRSFCTFCQKICVSSVAQKQAGNQGNQAKIKPSQTKNHPRLCRRRGNESLIKSFCMSESRSYVCVI